MGIGFVVIILGIFAVILALAGAGGLVLVVWGILSLFNKRSKAILIAAAVIPWVSLAAAGGLFVFGGAVNLLLLKRDVGIGDGFQCPLPNGYMLSAIDTLDVGMVSSSRAMYGSNRTYPDERVDGVTALQVHDKFTFLTAHSDGGSALFAKVRSERPDPDTFVLLDANAKSRRDFQTLEDLRAAADKMGAKLEMKPLEDVYAAHRWTFFDILILLMIIAVPFFLLLALGGWIVAYLRRPELEVAELSWE